MLEEMCKYMMSQKNYQISSICIGYPEMFEEMCKYMMSQTNYQVSSSLLG
jgi:hypothetical protein